MKNKAILGTFLLLITAFIWGSAFVAQSVGVGIVKPFTYNGIRCLLAGICLFPVTTIIDEVDIHKPHYIMPGYKRVLSELVSGVICGVVLFLASSIQQYGIAETTVGRAGFISVLYIIIVPLIQFLLKKPLPKFIFISIPIALVGMYFLCFTSAESGFGRGDLLVFVSSFLFAAHILVIDYFAPHMNGVKLSCIQFLTAGLLGVICMLIFDRPAFEDVKRAWLPIAYSGIMSGGVAYTLQVIAQKWTPASIASLVMSLEATFAVISGVIILKEIPTEREIIGCILMFAAIIIVQLDQFKKNGNEESAVR